MIRWILLLQEFELHIVQRMEEQPNPLDQVVAAAVCIPPGTIEEKRRERVL